MTAEFYIQWRSGAGLRRSILTGATGAGGRNGFLALAYRRVLNAPGWFSVTVPAELSDLTSYADKDQVEIYYRDAEAGIAWQRDFDGVFRDEVWQDDARGQERVTLSGPGALGRLAWYHVLWPANITNRTTFSNVPAETVLKTLVRYNAVAADATTANGRDRNAPNHGISIQTDAGGGNTLSVNTGSRKNLLSVLHDIQPLAGGDFDLVRTGANAWQFRFYAGGLGTDRTTSLVFAKPRGTMADMRYELRRSQEATAAVVGGQGEGEARTFVVRTTGPNYSTANDIETFVAATNVPQGTASETAQLNAAGDARLQELAARPTFSFRPLTTEALRYRRDFELGDRATAYHPRVGSIVVQIVAIEWTWEAGKRAELNIEVEVRDG